MCSVRTRVASLILVLVDHPTGRSANTSDAGGSLHLCLAPINRLCPRVGSLTPTRVTTDGVLLLLLLLLGPQELELGPADPLKRTQGARTETREVSYPPSIHSFIHFIHSFLCSIPSHARSRLRTRRGRNMVNPSCLISTIIASRFPSLDLVQL